MRPPLLTTKDFFVGFLITAFVSTVLIFLVIAKLDLDLSSMEGYMIYGANMLGNLVWMITFLYLVKRRLERVA